MKRNGMQALDFHGPALVRGDLTYLHGARYVHKVVALCFLPSAGLVPAALIDRHAEGFQGVDAALVMVASGARLLHRLWIGRRTCRSRRFWPTPAADSIDRSAWSSRDRPSAATPS